MIRSKFVAAGVLLAVGLVSVPAALAQRDAGSKIRGEFGTGFSGPTRSRSMTSRSYRYSAPSYARSVAPTVVAPVPASPEVAQGPTQRRAFSANPSLESAPAVQSGPTVRYYEPAPRSYSAPRTRRSSRTPTYFLPKTDPRRFGG